MTEKSQVIIIATDLILIIRDLERISNHLENIADSIVFIVEGKRIRHSAIRCDESDIIEICNKVSKFLFSPEFGPFNG